MQSPRNQKEEEATKKKTLGGFSKLRLLLRLLSSAFCTRPRAKEERRRERERESCVKENNVDSIISKMYLGFKDSKKKEK